jgi:hypothetical protein
MFRIDNEVAACAPVNPVHGQHGTAGTGSVRAHKREYQVKVAELGTSVFVARSASYVVAEMIVGFHFSTT